MKKNLIRTIAISAVVFSISSCQVSTVCVGEMKNDDPAVCVQTIHNSHFLGGLIGHKEISASEYVSGKTDYKVEKSRSFVDGLLSSVTMGIYTPSTTKIYLPAKNNSKAQKR